MTTLEFTLPSNPGCAPLSCGVDNEVMVPLIEASAGKSADGAGYLRGTIATAIAIDLTTWKYTVEIEDSEIAEGQTVTEDDVTGTLCCLSCSDRGILAKMAAAAPPETPLNWQQYQLFPAADGVIDSEIYLLRRPSAFQLHKFQIAIVSGTGVTSVRLWKTGANGTSYSAFSASLSITHPAKTAQRVYTSPLTVGANEALQARVTSAADTGSAHHFGLELHLLTSEP